MIFTSKRREENLLKGVTSGLLAGLVGTVVMTQFQTVWNMLAEKLGEAKGSRSTNSDPEEKASQGDQKSASVTEDEKPATVKAADTISENIFDHELTKSEEKAAGQVIHYAMGATSGALYGILAELRPEVTVGSGAPFGAAVWLVADETLIPALGLAKPPTRYPLSTHAYTLAAHLVYGLATDAARRKIRDIL